MKGSIIMGNNGISAYNSGYSNYASYSDDFLAQQLLKNSAMQDSILSSNTGLTQDSVSFSGKQIIESDSAEEKSNTGTILTTAALGIGAFLVGKNWNTIKGLFNQLLKGKTGKHVKTALERAKNKMSGIVHPNKKHSIKGTSVKGANAPVSNAQEARILQNIDTKHANSKSRKLVNQHMDDIVTPEMQARYNREIAYQPLTPKQKAAKAQMDSANRAQRAEMNAIKNNSKGSEKIETVAQAAKKAETAAKTIKDGAHINPNNKNIYFTKNGQVTQIRTATPNSKGEYIISDPAKIAKHLAKHKININEFAAQAAQAA